MSIRDELEAIQGDQELLMPEDVVNWARSNPGSALHKSFEWNNDRAAENWRIWQARRLIAITITSDEGYREMVSLSIDRSGDGGYRKINDVLPIPNLRDMMLADALRDLDRLQKKYAKLQELTSVWEAAHAVQARGGRRRGRRGVAERSADMHSAV